MTDLLERIGIRAESRLIGIIVVGLSVLIGGLLVAKRTFGTVFGGGADLPNHYSLVYWFSHHWSLPPANDPALIDMTKYPPGAHILASLVGRVVGSPFRGMQLVAIVAIVLVWCAIGAVLVMLPARRRWVAVVAVAVFLALDWSGGPLQLQVNGYELVSNFFFAEIVGQAIVWWVVWFAVRRLAAGRPLLSTAIPVAVLAVLTTVVHLLPAVELLGFATCLCAYELVRRWGAGKRRLALAAPVAVPALGTVLLVLTPGYRAMRSISTNNGALGVPYFSGLAGYIGVAVATAIVSLLVLVVAARRARDPATRAVLQGLGFLGIAIAVPCLLQAVALADGQGSAYAVKKYIFGLLTVLVVDAAAVVSALLPRLGLTDHNRSHRSTHAVAVIAFAVLAIFSVFSHPGDGYSVSTITTLERQANDFAHAAQLYGSGRAYAIDLPNSNPVFDYMFSLTAFGAPMNSVNGTVLGGQMDLAMSEFVTGARSPLDVASCRRFGPRDGMVVIGSSCWQQNAVACRSVEVLGGAASSGYYEIDAQLSGFSYPQANGEWTDATTATLRCYLPRGEATEPVTIVIDGTAFVPFASSRQRITLAARGIEKQFLLTAKVPSAALRLTVPSSASRWLDVTISLPDAVSPLQLGVSGDARPLGLYVSRIQVS